MAEYGHITFDEREQIAFFRVQAEILIKDYINNFYNSRRRHSSLGNISPMRYENMAA